MEPGHFSSTAFLNSIRRKYLVVHNERHIRQLAPSTRAVHGGMVGLKFQNSSMTSGCARSTFAAMDRIDGRSGDELRPVAFDLGIAPYAGGSVLVAMGNTRVICGVTIEENVPRWMKEQGVTGGWLSAEYAMLPYSTQPRKPRDIAKGRID